MKRLILLVFLLVTASASAQETYSISVGGTTTNRNSIVGQIQLGREQNNTDVCTRAVLPATCTQAQACVALNVVGGASCTATDAITANARIYPDSLAGRESFVANHLVRFRAPIYQVEQIVRDAASFKAYCLANTASVCTLAGLPVGCTPCG